MKEIISSARGLKFDLMLEVTVKDNEMRHRSQKELKDAGSS